MTRLSPLHELTCNVGKCAVALFGQKSQLSALGKTLRPTKNICNFQAFHTSFHTLPRRQPQGGSFQPLSVTTFLAPSKSVTADPTLSDPGGVATLGRRKRLSSSHLTECSDHIYALVQPKDKRMSTTSSASLASSSQPPPNLLDLIPPPPTYPPSPPLLSKRKQLSCGTVASEAIEETSRLLMTDECDESLSHENGYAKLKRNKNKVEHSLIFLLLHTSTILDLNLNKLSDMNFTCNVLNTVA